MITVKELITKLKGMPENAYVSIGDGVLHGGLGSEYTSYLLGGEVTNRGPVDGDDYLEFDETSEKFRKEYDQTRPWIDLE